MFFLLSKIVGFIALPSNATALVCGLGLCLLIMKRRRAGTGLLATGVMALLIFGYSPLGNVLLLTLSERFPAWHFDGREPDGIIILGGAIEPELSAARKAVEVNGAAERIIGGLELARRFPRARVVYSGGSANLIADPVSEAPIAGRLLETFGISPERIVLESESRTTDENARFTRKLVSPKPGERWLLVTSAYHMPRSIGVFRKAGLDVEAYPVDWRTRGWIDAWTPFDRLSAGLARADTAVHEWCGLLAYRLTGRSDALFPGPRQR
ncbi:protein of unknown function DUF218 [Nitrobacter hamburgensis X14]|uniref:DUF218 domain-containing protein n=1 Tax=Nitrobacter hamburgensis (strain DSM 10229 / NCIMB 13809 / X14) TaxID=323097 RepID=Q1QKM6_NITHX|nr:YdcF family protein [Nitrobacter hamburgensis]ABE63221.1 protein of unknown function DUF218 [Nitrobacter hamburgensis X14]